MSTGFSHPQSLAGRTAIVTGAAQGVGKGIARALLSRGAAVLLTDHQEERRSATSAEFADFSCATVLAELRDRQSPQRIVDAALGAFGRVDALINNAVATNEPKPFVDITVDDYDLVFDTAPRATFFLMQAVYPTMAAAKEAVRGMSKAAALEWGRDNVRVNVVCPFADSEGVQYWRDIAPKDFDRALRSVPLRRVGRTNEDVGAVVAFLVSDEAAYLTGQTINVDGGMGVFR